MPTAKASPDYRDDIVSGLEPGSRYTKLVHSNRRNSLKLLFFMGLPSAVPCRRFDSVPGTTNTEEPQAKLTSLGFFIA